MNTLDGILSFIIKLGTAVIVGCVAYIYVKTLKNPNYAFKLPFWG